MTAGRGFSTLGNRILHKGINGFYAALQNHRAHGDAFLQTIAQLDITHRSGEFFNEGFINALLDQETGRGDADLAGVAEFGQRQLFGGSVEIGIVKNQHLPVATQLHGGFFHVLAGQCRQMFTHAGGAGERDFANGRMRDQVLGDLRRSPIYQRDNARRHACVGKGSDQLRR